MGPKCVGPMDVRESWLHVLKTEEFPNKLVRAIHRECKRCNCHPWVNPMICGYDILTLGHIGFSQRYLGVRPLSIHHHIILGIMLEPLSIFTLETREMPLLKFEINHHIIMGFILEPLSIFTLETREMLWRWDLSLYMSILSTSTNTRQQMPKKLFTKVSRVLPENVECY